MAWFLGVAHYVDGFRWSQSLVGDILTTELLCVAHWNAWCHLQFPNWFAAFNSKFNWKKFIVSLSTNEYWTLIQVHNHKHDSGLGTTLRDISKLYFFAGWKHVDYAATATKKWTVVTSHGGCPTKVLNCLAQNNIHFILNETKGARSSGRAYVPQICLSLFRHNTYDGVQKTKQNVLTTTSDHLWSLVIHRIHILVPQELSKMIYLNNHKRSFGERW